MDRRYLYLFACILFGFAAVATLIGRESIAEIIGVAVYAVFIVAVIWECMALLKRK